MSGGVDSAVAAARMLDAGHEVVGVHLALSQSAATLRESARGCCTIEDAGDARRVADVLGIPFYVWDMADRFKRDVVEDFTAEYAAGRTPNPCLRCNEKIKFVGAARQGRGARLRRRRHRPLRPDRRGHGRGRELHRAVDAAKDQSYVLGVLDADQLARAFLARIRTIPADVWVDGKGRLRKVRLRVAASSAKTKGSVAFEYFDLGASVNVEAPPASEVVDFEELLGGSPTTTGVPG